MINLAILVVKGTMCFVIAFAVLAAIAPFLFND